MTALYKGFYENISCIISKKIQHNAGFFMQSNKIRKCSLIKSDMRGICNGI